MSATKRTSAEVSSSILVQLPNALLSEVAKFLVLDDILKFVGVSKLFSASLQPILDKTLESFMTIKLLEAVLCSNNTKVRELISVHPQLILQKAPVTDKSGRQFFCTPLQLAYWLSDADIFGVMIDSVKGLHLVNKASIEIGALGYKEQNMLSLNVIPPSASFNVQAACDAYAKWSQAFTQNPVQPLKKVNNCVKDEQKNLPAHYLLKILNHNWNVGYQTIQLMNSSSLQSEKDYYLGWLKGNLPTELKPFFWVSIISELTKTIKNESLESLSWADLCDVAPYVIYLKGRATPRLSPPLLDRGARFSDNSPFLLTQLSLFIQQVDTASKQQIEVKRAEFGL